MSRKQMATNSEALPSPLTLYNAGMALRQKGRRDDALGCFVSVIAQRPDLAEAWWQAALIFLEADNFTEALRHAKKAVDLRPKEPTVWATWADAVALSGDRAAEAEFLAALRKARLELAFLLRLQDRFGANRKGARGSLGSAPPAEVEAVSRLIQSGNLARAERETEVLLAKVEDSPVLYNMLGVIRGAMGKAEASLEPFQVAVRVDPFFAEAFFNLARTLAELEQKPQAEAMVRAAIARAPSFGPALMLYGDLLTDDHRGAQAIHYLERALVAKHRPGEVLRILAQALIDCHRFEEASVVLQDAMPLVTSSETKASVLALEAQLLMRTGKPAQALAATEAALLLVPSHVGAMGRKALTLQTLGRFEEARPIFLAVMEADPKNGGTFRSYMTGNKAQPGDEIVERMLRLIEQPGLTARQESNFGFAIAKGLEDQKEYTRAFPYLKRANDLMAKLTPYDHKARLDEIRKVQDAARGIDWAGRAVAGASAASPIFVTGMPRSGTTLIEQIISSHSRVTGGDEMDILPRLATALSAGPSFHAPLRRADAIPDTEIAKLGHDYLAEVAKRYPGADIVSDKSITSYMYLGLVKLALPNARFIVVRRDPRDNLLSIYKNRFPDGAHTYAYDLRALAEHYATFVEMIEFWRSEVPDWFTEVQYETLVANPEEESRRLIAACGLEWEEACLNFHRNERQVRTLSVYQVRQPISKGSVAAWQRYEKELQPMFEVLAERGLLPE